MKGNGKAIIVVVGSGRSGSSVITRGLQVLGVSLGDNLMPALPDVNDKGFWEDQDVYSLNREIFKELGEEWHSLAPFDPANFSTISRGKFKSRAVDLLDRKMKGVKCFGVKDPQMTRLLPFWQGVFSSMDVAASYVVTCRNPKNVALSLARYTGFSEAKSYLVWSQYVIASLKHTSGKKRIVVDYDRMMASTSTQLMRMAKVLELPFDSEGSDYRSFEQEFLEHSLRHGKFQQDDLEFDNNIPTKIKSLYALLSDLAEDIRDTNSTETTAFVETEAARCRRPEVVLSNVLAELESVRGQLYALRTALEIASADLMSRTEELVAIRQARADDQVVVDRLSADLVERSEDLLATRQLLSERTALLERSNSDLSLRDEDLVELRNLLTKRTEAAESFKTALEERLDELRDARHELAHRTDLFQQQLLLQSEDLNQTRDILSQRTKLLEDTSAELIVRTELLEAASKRVDGLSQELTEARDLALERTDLLGRTDSQLQSITRDLIEVREVARERTEMLEKANSQLEDTTKELVEVRGVALDRTKQLERCNTDLVERTNLLVRGNERIKSLSQELADLREVVVERTALLDHASVALVDRTTQLDRANEGLEAFSLDVTKWREAVNERTDLLEQLTAQFEERGHMLADANRELEANKMNLAEAREEIESKARLLELANSEIARLSRSLLNRLWSQVQGR